jgi:hypothetical protein
MYMVCFAGGRLDSKATFCFLFVDGLLAEGGEAAGREAAAGGTGAGGGFFFRYVPKAKKKKKDENERKIVREGFQLMNMARFSPRRTPFNACD